MARFNLANETIAREIIARYPKPKSATIPLCHLAQEQDGYLTADAMAHISELVGVTPAEVLGTASFYEMFKLKPCGTYLVGVCTNISCMLVGGEELLHHAEKTLGVRHGGTTADGMFTLEEMECLAACTEAPATQVNYRYFNNLTPEAFDQLIVDLRDDKLQEVVPPHGTLSRVRQHITAERAADPAHAAPAVVAPASRMVSVVEEDAQVVPITKTTRRKNSKDGEASKDPS
jgi:NADH-quinone oxidoreductase subunit E